MYHVQARIALEDEIIQNPVMADKLREKLAKMPKISWEDSVLELAVNRGYTPIVKRKITETNFINRNLVMYIATKTSNLDLQKLYLLLYLIDLEMYRQTGFNYSNQIYNMSSKGPVPYSPISGKLMFEENKLSSLFGRKKGILRLKEGLAYDKKYIPEEVFSIAEKICKQYFFHSGKTILEELDLPFKNEERIHFSFYEKDLDSILLELREESRKNIERELCSQANIFSTANPKNIKK